MVSFIVALGSHVALCGHAHSVPHLPQGTANGSGALFSRLSQGVTKVTLLAPPGICSISEQLHKWHMCTPGSSTWLHHPLCC